MKFAWQLLFDVILLDDPSCGLSIQQMRRIKQWEQTEQVKHWHTGIQTVWCIHTERERETQDRAPDRQTVWSQWQRGSDTFRTMWLHALATRAVVAAAAVVVPEQSPPAAQLWGVTPESPYWSLEWAETHFLWAQATWRKEQKVLRQVFVKWWEGGGLLSGEGEAMWWEGVEGRVVWGRRDKGEGEWMKTKTKKL